MFSLRNSMKRATALLLSSLMTVSAFSIITNLNVGAVSYSEMSALDQYAYSGNDLGAVYTKNSTTFKVWAPTATKVQVKFYTTGSDSEAGAAVLGTYDMSKQSQGIWSYTATGDYAGVYYTYIVTTSSGTHETVDIYARSTGVNGLRGMVVDLDSTDPAGWENDRRVSCDNQTDAVVWEAHVRDFSIAANSGVSEQNKGKFLAFTETGTTVNNDGQHPTGIDYLEELGITHVHLLPVFDYGSVDETRLNTDQFNWGYDPMNYNVPEGSYSTNPYDGNVRVNEFKQMVQSLHEKNIGVVMDVVYNHTYAGSSGKNDWFDYTVPGYYYRQTSTGSLADGSGCGNETASDRAMYQKYMIDSVVYWATEYHIDGFRFDLMGLHDVDTMNKIRQALDEIDPDILVYGEPWNAGSTASSKATAVQSNMSQVSEEISAFNDKIRDTIKGSCFNGASTGFIQGATGYETALKSGIQANATTMAGTDQWSKQPSQTVTYTSAHDNYTLYDKLIKSVKGGSGYGNRYDDLVAMNKLAGGIILTSQGMSFFQAGEEFARTKYGDDNSYASSTSVNQLDWNRTIEYADIVSYYKGLIEIRKAYSPFRDPTNTSNGTMYFSWGSSCPSNVVAYTMYNKLNSNEWNFVAVIHNANSTSQTVTLQTYDNVTLPSQWVIVADGTNAGTVSLGTTGSTVTVPARSTVVLVDKTSFDSVVLTKKGSVTVNHVIQSTGENYKTETLSGAIGTSYTTAPLTALTNNGYKVSTVSGSTSGVYSENAQTVTYYYTLDTENYGNVVVKYVDASTLKEIAATDTYSGRVGTSYSYEPKSVRNYEVDLTQTDNASGTFAKGTITVIFKYNYVEPSGLTIHYYNSNNWSSVYMYVYTESGSTATMHAGAWPGTQMTNDGNGWYSGHIDDVESALFIANNNNQGSQDPSGVNSTGYSVSGEVWVKNGKVYPTGKVSVVYKDTQGNILATETLTGMADGSNSYTTTAKSFENYTLETTPSNATGVYAEGTTTVTYIYKSLSAALVNQTTINSESILKGETVTFTNRASGGTTPYQFKIEVKHSTASAYTTIQAYSTSTTKTWTPAQSGEYDIQASVKDASGVVATKSFSLTVADVAQSLTNNSTLSATSITKGQSVTMTGKATGGTSPYQYAMVVRHSTDSAWTTLKAYNTTATKTWTPAKTGTYTVQIKVKDASGTAVVKSFTLTVTAATTALANNSTLSATSITKGQSVTMTGKATGGTAPYQYAMVVRHSTDSAWTTLKAYNTTATKTWTPAKTGTYTVQIKVKDAKGTAVVKTFTLTVKAASTALANSSTISATSITKGQSVTMTGKATGGTAPYQYAMVVRHSTDSAWTTLKAYNTTATKTWTPAKTGTYTVQIKVKDAKGTAVVKTFTLTVKAASTALANSSTISATSITKGQSVTMTGKATGGTAPYQYAMVVRHSTDSAWTTLKAYNTTATKTWTPAKTGTYTVQIKVKDAKGTAVVKSFTLTVKAATTALTNNSTLSATSITKGQSVTMTGKATGGTSPYQYAMVVKHSTDSAWTILKDYNTTATKTWTPAKTGTYTVQIKVMDAKGTAVVKSFTLTVKAAS